MDATFERTGEEGILSFCMQTKTGNVIINTLMPPKSHTIPDRRSFPENIPA